MSAVGLKLIENPPASLHEDILSQLRDFIVEGHLDPGARIPERELCGSSTSPARHCVRPSRCWPRRG